MSFRNRSSFGMAFCFVLGASACDPPESPPAPATTPNHKMPAPTGGSSQPTGNGDIFSTRNPNAFLRGGYHTLYDKATSTSCVEAAADSEAPYTVGDVSETFELVYVDKREQLARELNIDLGMKVRYGVVEGDASMKLVNSFTSNSRSVNVLIKLKQEYQVINRQPMRLTTAARSSLDENGGEFTAICGTHYMAGVRYGANLMILITYSASNEESATDMKATLGVSSAALPVTGDMKTRLHTASTLSGVTVNISASTQGVLLAGDKFTNQTISAAVDGKLFEQVDAIRAGMTKSVQFDVCRDAGTTTCGDEPGPGYFANKSRNVQPTGIILGFYESLPNATWDGDVSPFQLVRDRLSHVERFVRDYSEVQIRYEDIYLNEVKPFLDATPAYKAMYNIAPDGKPVFSPSALQTIATDLDEKFYPERGTVIGWKTQEVVDRIKDCWDQASVNLFTSCTSKDEPLGDIIEGKELAATDTKQWNDLYNEIISYAKHSRILPISARIGEEPVPFGDAADVCKKLSKSESLQYRLPTKSEARVLAPMVAYGNIQWAGATVPSAIWYSDVKACGDGYPYFKNDPESASQSKDPTFECAPVAGWWDQLWNDDYRLVPICIPAAGPLPVTSWP